MIERYRVYGDLPINPPESDDATDDDTLAYIERRREQDAEIARKGDY